MRTTKFQSCLLAALIVTLACLICMRLDIPQLEDGSVPSLAPLNFDGPLRNVRGHEMREILSWSFAQGNFPDTWGWGDWTKENGLLRGSHSEGPIIAYMMPLNCDHDFIIETRVRATGKTGEKDVNVQLLIRDDHWLNHESGVTFWAGSNLATVRHMARGTEFILDIIEMDDFYEYNEWQTVQFGIVDGHIVAAINGKDLPTPSFKYPVAQHYYEPHYSIDMGEAEFQYFKVYTLP